MDKQPTEARQDELAGIDRIGMILRQKYLFAVPYKHIKKIDKPAGHIVLIKGILCEYDIEKIKEQFLSPTVSSGGICPECDGKKQVIQHIKTIGREFEGEDMEFACPACNGTGRTKVVEKTLGAIIKEWEDVRTEEG